MDDTMITVPLAELQDLFDQQGIRDADDQHHRSATPFVITLTEVSDARVRARVDFRGSYMRPGGLVAGPVLFSIVDASGWLATVSRLAPGSEAMTIDCTIRYLAPVPSGSRLRGRVRIADAEDVPPDGLRVTYGVTIEIEGGTRPACVAELIALHYR